MNLQYSAVATVYNDADDIVRLLDDVCNQTIKPSEFIIVDGGSKDSTMEVIREYAKKTTVTIRLSGGERLNISQGLNIGISLSRYEWISIFAVGNHYEREFAEHLLKSAESDGLDIAYSLIQGVVSSEFSRTYNAVYGYDRGFDQGIASNHGVLVKKNVFRRIGLFYEYFHYAGEDAEFFERAEQSFFRIGPVKTATAYWDVPSSMHEFKKQLKVYTIAQLQYFSIYRLVRTFGHNLKLWLRIQIQNGIRPKSEDDRLARQKYFYSALFMIRYCLFLLPEKRFDAAKISFLG